LKQQNKITGRLLCRKSNDKNETEFQHGNCFPSSSNSTNFVSQDVEIISQGIGMLTSSPSEVQSVTEADHLAAGTEEL
jgi:hypothetical protein